MERTGSVLGSVFGILCLAFAARVMWGDNDKEPPTAHTYEIRVWDSNLLGIDVPWKKPEPAVYLSHETPHKINLLGSRYGFHDTDGNWIEFKGSREFEVREITPQARPETQEAPQ